MLVGMLRRIPRPVRPASFCGILHRRYNPAMKRAGRWLFNFAAVVSVLICIVLVVLGTRSFWEVASVAIDHRGGTRVWIEVERGQLGVWKQRRLEPATQPARLLAI